MPTVKIEGVSQIVMFLSISFSIMYGLSYLVSASLLSISDFIFIDEAFIERAEVKSRLEISDVIIHW